MGDSVEDLDLTVDPAALPEEWLGQPELMLRWTSKHAQALLEVDRAKAGLDVAKAMADREIRENPEKHGLTKVTEAVVANAVILHPAVQAAVQVLGEARYAANLLQGAVHSIEDRRRALQSMVELGSREWFAGGDTPPTPRGVRPRGG